MERLSAPPLFRHSCDLPSRPWCCPRDSWVARDIILPYSLTYMRLMIEAVAFKAGSALNYVVVSDLTHARVGIVLTRVLL